MTQPFTHFVLHPKTQKVFKKHGCAGMKRIPQGVLRKNATELYEPVVPNAQFLLACAFVHPPAQRVPHAFRPCSRHIDVSRQAVLSVHRGRFD